MPRPAKPSATSVLALETAAVPTPARLAAGAVGEAGSTAALTRLNAAVLELRAISIQPLLQRAIDCLNGGDFQAGGEWAIKALDRDERNGFGWYLLAISRERLGDFPASVRCYESALALLPDHAEVANDLGRLAYRMGMKEHAEKLFRHFLIRFPGHHEGSNNLACAVRDLGRYPEAIEILTSAITEHQAEPMLWNTMGTVVAEQGDAVNAQIFFAEAIRLQPDFPKARYNLGNTRLALGDAEGALEDCDAAMSGPLPLDERLMMRLARSTILMALGRIGEGWDEYEARLDPAFADVTDFLVEASRWTPDSNISGKHLLVIGEQGLGDEVLFANTLPDVIADLGDGGRLSIAVEPRLISLFQRSFPQARVAAHGTFNAGTRTLRTTPFGEEKDIDLWAPMASLLRRYRRSVDAFPQRERFLIPDPERVAHWKAELERAPAGPKVGLLWKSAVKSNARHRYFSPFQQWAPVLATPGVSFVNLQYGDCSEELDYVRRELGVEVWSPPGIDLKQDLDDVAALGCALDLTVGFSNATLNLAAACGAPTWLISTPGAWPRLGTPIYPWYPQVQVFMTPAFGDWDPVMADVADALADFAARPER